MLKASYADAGGQGDREFGAAESSQPPQRWQVNQPDGGVDDDRAQRGGREPRQHRPQEQQDGHHRCGRGQRVKLGPAAGGHADSRPGRAAADREAAHQARARVGDAERQQLLVGPDLLVAPCERPRGQHVIAETHDQHGERGQQQLAQHVRGNVGQPGDRQGRRDRADNGDPVAAQAKQDHGGGGQQHGQQRARRMWPAPAQQQQEDQHSRRERDRRRLHPAQAAGKRTHLREERLPGDRHAGHPPELIGNHDQRHARHVADQHRPRQQIRHETQPQQPGGHRHHPHQQGKRGGETGIPDRIAGRQRRDRDGRHQRGRGLRAHRQGKRDEPSTA